MKKNIEIIQMACVYARIVEPIGKLVNITDFDISFIGYYNVRTYMDIVLCIQILVKSVVFGLFCR